jgi:hypothetical protein
MYFSLFYLHASTYHKGKKSQKKEKGIGKNKAVPPPIIPVVASRADWVLDRQSLFGYPFGEIILWDYQRFTI